MLFLWSTGHYYMFHGMCCERRGSICLNCRQMFLIIRLLESYCFVLLTNRAPPQISDNRPDMRHRALLVTSRAVWRWNKMLLARENVDSPLAAMVLATEHNAL